MSSNDLQISRLLKDSVHLRAYSILIRINHELRIPTVERLFCDIMGIVNCDARAIITYMCKEGHFKETKGWVKAI